MSKAPVTSGDEYDDGTDNHFDGTEEIMMAMLIRSMIDHYGDGNGAHNGGTGVYGDGNDEDDETTVSSLKMQAKPFYLNYHNLHEALLVIVLLIMMMLLMMILTRMAMTVITGAKPFCRNPHIPIRGEIGLCFLL